MQDKFILKEYKGDILNVFEDAPTIFNDTLKTLFSKELLDTCKLPRYWIGTTTGEKK